MDPCLSIRDTFWGYAKQLYPIVLVFGSLGGGPQVLNSFLPSRVPTPAERHPARTSRRRAAACLRGIKNPELDTRFRDKSLGLQVNLAGSLVCCGSNNFHRKP